MVLPHRSERRGATGGGGGCSGPPAPFDRTLGVGVSQGGDARGDAMAHLIVEQSLLNDPRSHDTGTTMSAQPAHDEFVSPCCSSPEHQSEAHIRVVVPQFDAHQP